MRSAPAAANDSGTMTAPLQCPSIAPPENLREIPAPRAHRTEHRHPAPQRRFAGRSGHPRLRCRAPERPQPRRFRQQRRDVAGAPREIQPARRRAGADRRAAGERGHRGHRDRRPGVLERAPDRQRMAASTAARPRRGRGVRPQRLRRRTHGRRGIRLRQPHRPAARRPRPRRRDRRLHRPRARRQRLEREARVLLQRCRRADRKSRALHTGARERPETRRRGLVRRVVPRRLHRRCRAGLSRRRLDRRGRRSRGRRARCRRLRCHPSLRGGVFASRTESRFRSVPRVVRRLLPRILALRRR